MHSIRPNKTERGAALFIVMVVVLLSVLAVLWASRSARFNTIATSNDSDYQRAMAAAQAMVRDAELDILGQRPDGTPCTETSGAACRGSTVSANHKLAHYPYPGEVDLNAALVETLDAQTPSCIAGICTPKNVAPAFWSDAPKFEQMKGVAAVYGQYTGAKVTQQGNSLLHHDASTTPRAWYWVELLPYNVAGAIDSADNASAYRPDAERPYVFRITALANGLKPGTQVLIQTLFVLRRADS